MYNHKICIDVHSNSSMINDETEYFRKSLKGLYDDLCDAENKQDKEPFGFKNRLQVIYENTQDLEMKICGVLGLGDFVVLPDFEPEYLRRGEPGMAQMLKSQIKLLAVEIDLDLEQNSTKTIRDNPVDTTQKHKWTRGEKIALAGVIATILGIVFALLL